MTRDGAVIAKALSLCHKVNLIEIEICLADIVNEIPKLLGVTDEIPSQS